MTRATESQAGPQGYIILRAPTILANIFPQVFNKFQFITVGFLKNSGPLKSPGPGVVTPTPPPLGATVYDTKMSDGGSLLHIFVHSKLWAPSLGSKTNDLKRVILSKIT